MLAPNITKEYEMHWTQSRQKNEAYAKAKKNGFHKNPPPTAEEQARFAELLNKYLPKNVQLQLT
jgi:hypothetical protein